MTERREVEVYSAEGWVAVSGLETVRDGQLFRMFRPDGTPYIHEGCTVMMAKGDGLLLDGVGGCEFYPLGPPLPRGLRFAICGTRCYEAQALEMPHCVVGPGGGRSNIETACRFASFRTWL
jgi:hypothetical protein